MLFLLLRLSPYIIPILFLASAKAVFIFSDSWIWCLAAIIILPLAYSAFLKQQNRDKPVFWLMIFAVIFAVSGFAYSLILESATVINVFLIVWSLVYWFYLEAVFHDFYKTAKSDVFNLLNILLYGSILIIFFLTATLASFNIFLNLSWLWLLLTAAVVYFSIIYLVFQRSFLTSRRAALYAGITDLILIEILGGLLLWPSSFYVIAVIVALCYYLLTQITLYVSADKLNRGRLVRLLLFSGLILLIVLATAAWL